MRQACPAGSWRMGRLTVPAAVACRIRFGLYRLAIDLPLRGRRVLIMVALRKPLTPRSAAQARGAGQEDPPKVGFAAVDDQLFQ